MENILIAWAVANLVMGMVKGFVLDASSLDDSTWGKFLLSILFTFSLIGKGKLNVAGKVAVFLIDLFCLPISLVLVTGYNAILIIGVLFGVLFLSNKIYKE